MAQESIVSMQDVNLSFGTQSQSIDILKNASLDVKKGETLSIVGPSGAGKTSLLMVMGGMERPKSGKIEIAGQSITQMSEDELAHFRGQTIGVVFQSFHLIPTMTAIENVALPLELTGDKKAIEKAQNELEAVGLGHRFTHYPSELSGGEQQRVSIARALAPQPNLLIADEPTGNLDSETGQEIIDLIFQANKDREMTLVLVTHDHALAAKCTRQVTIQDGAVSPIQVKS